MMAIRWGPQAQTKTDEVTTQTTVTAAFDTA